jgi:hypothetical protein
MEPMKTLKARRVKGTFWNCLKVAILALGVLGLAGCGVAAKVNPDSAKLAVELPIADLHCHPSLDLSPSDAKKWMDENGVRWAGAGVRRGDASTWRDYSKELGNRFIAFAGQTELNRAYFEGGVAAMEDAKNPIVSALLTQVEEDLKAGRIQGVGEIFVNNSNSSLNPAFRRKVRADAPSIRLLYQVVAKYGAFLTFHMEADSDNIAEMERLLASDRKGRILWNHCGVNSTADQVRPLLARHANLFCELSFRHPPALEDRTAQRQPTRKIFDPRGPDADWLKLIEDFPDRFLIGTDVESPVGYGEAIRVVRIGLLAYLLPSTARKVAYENAQRLFGLK